MAKPSEKVRARRRDRALVGVEAEVGVGVGVGVAFAVAVAVVVGASVMTCRAPDEGRTVDVGGLQLHMHCMGRGTPAVVLEAGLGSDGSIWNKVEPDIARFAHVCDYDRAGLGRSGPATRPHSNRRMAQELHALLVQARIAGPYVLVGHSMGGVNVRLFAAQHPDEVAGMVLVDGGDDASAAFALLPDAALSEFGSGLLRLPEGLDLETFMNGFRDLRNTNDSLGDTPLVVLTHGKPLPPHPGIAREIEERMERLRGDLQAELPRLSSNGLQLIARNSGHFVQLDEPELVVAAVREVVAAARARRRLNAASILSSAKAR